ncbi:MAG: hypothetical protein ALECFALPRED_008207 [Alectoria fallacina]|uniref:Uncharacterized protein n=1 Tax=Alectoria fallacina TaxID=1903189 RepID=A0A8H3J318_9LECA|nr:MAG: hypothetical protein ALECFALPRED_008207 [Alectoria fallacina]
MSNNQFSQQQTQCNSDEIRHLRAEVAQLRGLPPNAGLQHESDGVVETLPASDNADNAKSGQAVLLDKDDQSPARVTDTELSDPRERSPHGYYNQHTLFQFFVEVPQLFPFIKETADEWLKPLGVHLKKNKFVRNDWKTNAPSQEEEPLEGLLPPKNDTDALILFYLNHLEQLHRIVHIPTFKREYANYWTPGRTRYPAMTALILPMMLIPTCASVSSSDSTSISFIYRTLPVQWISA